MNEKLLYLNDYVNCHTRDYGQQPIIFISNTKILSSQKISPVWVQIPQKRMFVTFFEETVNSNRYLLLVQQFPTTLTKVVQKKILFQQDTVITYVSRRTIAHSS